MINKYLVIIENLEDIKTLEREGITKFAFPFKSFSIGYNNYFTLDEIKCENAYLFINRQMDSFDIDNLRKELNNIPSNIKGIIFDDLGVLDIIKNKDLEKILYLSHFSTNKESVNLFLNYVDTLVLSTDITLDEINEILKSSTKELCIIGYGHINVSYSKRTLLKNYSNYHNLPFKNNLEIQNDEFKFICSENEYGTVLYDKNIFNGLSENYEDNIKYVLINLFNVSAKEFLNDKATNTHFLHKKTVYKLKGES